MACRLPGGIESPEKLWNALLAGDDLVTEVPRDRWDNDLYYDPEPGVVGRTVSKWGAFLDDVAGFDSDFFGINEREAAALDPQHRLLLETSWEAMEHAGLTPAAMSESRTGVFMGLTHLDYQLVNADSEAMDGPYGFEGNTFAMASGRIAYSMGLHGPALTLDTACSSGLMAVHIGVPQPQRRRKRPGTRRWRLCDAGTAQVRCRVGAEPPVPHRTLSCLRCGGGRVRVRRSRCGGVAQAPA